MRAAVRYCITAGVALGGISVLIAAPSSPPLRDVEVPALKLSDNSRDNPDAYGTSMADLLQTMGGVETPVVVQNLTESDAGVLEGGQPSSVPHLSDPSVSPAPIMDFTSGYVLRSIADLPKQGSKEPWKLRQNYAIDLRALRYGSLEDGAMTFSRRVREPEAVPA